MKKLISTVLLLSMVLASMIGMFAFPAGATETTPTEPDEAWYDANATTLEIKDANDLAAFAEKLAGGTTFQGVTLNLTQDIKLNGEWDGKKDTFPTDGYKWPEMTSTDFFAGIFDGKGYTIYGVYRETAQVQVGMFGNVGRDSNNKSMDVTLRDFTIAKSYFHSSGTQATALITLYDIPTPVKLTIDSVHVSADVLFESTETGAFYVGYHGWQKPSTILITNCIFSGTCRQLTSGKGMAAFIGEGFRYNSTLENNITIDSCAMYGIIEGSGDCISGIADDVRAKDNVTIMNCIVAGSVTANNSGNINYICRNSQGTYIAKNNIIVHDASKGNVAAKSHTGALTGLAAQKFLDEKGITNIVATTTSYPVFRDTETNNTVANAVTKYHGYQVNATEGKLRLIGLAGIAEEKLAEYDVVGFKVVGYYMEDGSKVNAFEAQKTTVYTSIKAGDETWTTTGGEYSGSYIFVQEITGVTTSKPILFEITTFHVSGDTTVNGNTTTVVLNAAA